MEKVAFDIRKEKDDLFNKMLEQLVNQFEKNVKLLLHISH